MRFIYHRTTNPSSVSSRAREPVTWGDVEQAADASARRMAWYAALIILAVVVLLAWTWLKTWFHG